MHVRKFEARSMKEALEMVKTHLGPEAIILSAKDNNKSFGLVGEGSVEITAAVSETTLHKKKFVESRLVEKDKDIFQKAPVKRQKEVIEKMVTGYLEKSNGPKEAKPITSMRYIDIDDENKPEREFINEAATARIRQAAARAKEAFGETTTGPRGATYAPPSKAEQQEIGNLKSEIEALRKIVSQFNNIPQNMMGSFPGAEFGLQFEFSIMFEKLCETGMAPEIVAEILRQAQSEIEASRAKNPAVIESWVARYILNNTPIQKIDQAKKFQLFLGLPGCGKTASLIKLASHLVVDQGKKIALVSTDSRKVGAAEQLKIYAQILNVPFGIIRTAEDWEVVQHQAEQLDYVLVDFPGSSLRSDSEMQFLRDLMPPRGLPFTTHLVMSALKKDIDAMEIGKRYRSVGYDDVVYTNIDEATLHGTIFNFVHRFQKPLFCFGMGQRIPEDFEVATAERMLDLIFKITSEA